MQVCSVYRYVWEFSSSSSLSDMITLPVDKVLDLTDIDWSPEVFIACYDNDQQNARLATNIWEENGLDVPEGFFSDLRPFLGTFTLHSYSLSSINIFTSEQELPHVRNACASSLADAVSHWPQSISGVLTSLQELYRDKVCLSLSELKPMELTIRY